jgi:hypothetical protein
VSCNFVFQLLTLVNNRLDSVINGRDDGLGRIFGPKKEEAAEDWKKLHNEELHDLYASPNIVRVIKSR